MYDIHFHDGDHLKKMISSKYLLRMDEFFKVNKFLKNPEPEEKYIVEYFQKGSMTPKELLENACTVCSQCTRKECGACSVCEQNRLSGARSSNQCCYQKVRGVA
jgi:hypothetical protein